MHRKFEDDIFARCLVTMKNVMSYIKEYSGPTLRPPCDVIDDIIIMKILFFCIIWDDLFISEAQIETVFNISKFSKWLPFWARYKLFYRKLYQKENIPET